MVDDGDNTYGGKYVVNPRYRCDCVGRLRYSAMNEKSLLYYVVEV